MSQPTSTTAEPREMPSRPAREERDAFLARVNEQADLAAFMRPSAHTLDSVWIRGLSVASRDLATDVPTAILISAPDRARLQRIAAMLERAEQDARLSPLERLGRELSSYVVQEIVHAQRQER